MLIDELKVKAENGDAQSQYELACLYSYGDTIEGVQLDFGEALKWFRKSAKQEYAPAHNAIGLAYDNGEGVKRNPKKAFKWIKKAADYGYVVAIRNLAYSYDKGDIVKKDEQKAKKYYEDVVERAKEIIEEGDKNPNYDSALYMLGICSEFGDGTEMDLNRATDCYEKATKLGHRAATFRLGICYYSGEGVGQDYKKAVELYSEAAKRGHARAQTNLGLCYENGEGVTRNFDEAKYWYSEAAKRNNVKAQCYLAELYENCKNTDDGFAEAVKWYTISAERGFDRAQYYLAGCYRYGKGVKKNLKKAIYWYKKAAEQDYWSAKIKLEELKNVKKSRKRKSLVDTKDNGVFDVDDKFAEYERFLREQFDIYDDEGEEQDGNAIKEKLLQSIDSFKIAFEQYCKSDMDDEECKKRLLELLNILKITQEEV